MSEDVGKKSCASYTAKCRLILVGGLRRDDADPLASSRRETEEIRGCTLHRLHTKKGLSGQQPHLHARAQQARQWSHKCSRRHPRPHSTPRTAGSERSGEWSCQRPQKGRFSMSCCKTKHKSEDNIANSGQNTAQIWIISTKAYTYSPRRISRANNRQKMAFSLSAEIRRGGIGRSGGSEEVSTEADRCRSGRRKAQRWQPDFQRRSSAGRRSSEAIPGMPNTRRTRHLAERWSNEGGWLLPSFRSRGCGFLHTFHGLLSLRGQNNACFTKCRCCSVHSVIAVRCAELHKMPSFRPVMSRFAVRKCTGTLGSAEVA